MALTHAHLDQLTLMDLIGELQKCEDLTVREHKALPKLSSALPHNDPYLNHRLVGAMPSGEVKKIIAMAHRYLVTEQKQTKTEQAHARVWQCTCGAGRDPGSTGHSLRCPRYGKD